MNTDGDAAADIAGGVASAGAEEQRRTLDLSAEIRGADGCAAIAAAIRSGVADAGVLGALEHLETGDDTDDLADAIEEMLDAGSDDLPLVDRVRWAAALFGLLGGSEVSLERRRDGAMRVLELAAAGGLAAWRLLADGDGIEALERACPEPLDRLAALEQELFAPEEFGVAVRALAMIEQLGVLHAHADDHATAREAERLLHAAGRPEIAYRVEDARRGAAKRRREASPAVAPREAEAPQLRGLVVAVAGGHPALRAHIRRDLRRSGVSDLREIPSAHEASRVGREVAATLAGADVVVLLIRQLAHSTSDQVRLAAAKSGTAAIVAPSGGVGTVRRALERWRGDGVAS
ncbi:MAG: hypothetical protein ACR2OO_00100 [Thermomicrobiales bacterium]